MYARGNFGLCWHGSRDEEDFSYSIRYNHLMHPSRSKANAAQGLLFALLAALLTLIVLGQSIPLRKTPARDYGFYVYIGDQILHGKLPYRDVWESKPPAIFYVDTLALILGRGTRWGIWAVEAFSLLAAIYLSFRLMNRLWGPWAALAGLLTWTYGLNATLMGGNMTEEYPLPLHFLALALFPALVRQARKRTLAFLLGLIFALCLLFRPNNAVTEAAVILVLLTARAGQAGIPGPAGAGAVDRGGDGAAACGHRGRTFGRTACSRTCWRPRSCIT